MKHVKCKLGSMLSCLVLVLLAACAQLDDSGEPEPSDEGDLGTVYIDPGHQNNGLYILGEAMDAIPGDDADDHFSAQLSATVRFVGDASLNVPNGVLLASNGDELEFTLVGQAGATSRYALVRTDTNTTPPTVSDPCDGGTAIPLLGTFTRMRVHVWDDTKVTFACDDGAASKCDGWGYHAGSDPTKQSGWGAHQVCSQAANAAYCATDESFTREQTAIEIADFVGVRGPPPAVLEGVRAWPPPPSEFYYEAAWLEGHEEVFCLGRARWNSLPPGGAGTCGGSILDPRTNNMAHFCEEYDFDGNGEGIGLPTTGPRIVLVNASAYNDLALHTWMRGTDHVSTVRGYDKGAPSLPPFPGGNWTHIGMDGILLRRPTGTIDPKNDLLPAFIHVGPNGDHVLGPVDPSRNDWPPSSNYDPPSGAPQEGWLFRRGGPGKAALNLYQRSVAGGFTEYLSTAVAPPKGAGYNSSGIPPLGYVIAPPQ